MNTSATGPGMRVARVALGVFCWLLTFALYLVAVRTGSGRDADNALFRQLRDRLAARTWIPDGSSLARDQLALLGIGVGVVCAACLVTRCSTRMTVAALAVACGPGVAAVMLKAFLIRPASWSDFASHNSFPSGTVAGLAGIAAALGYLAADRPRRALAAAAWLGVGLVSLIVIRAHWHRPSDVVGAVLLALGAWAVASGLCPRESARVTRPRGVPVHRNAEHSSLARR